LKEISKSSIQLNLNYQLIYLIKSMHCITKEPNNQTRKPNFFFFGFSLGENLAWVKIPLAWARIPLAWAKIHSLGRKQSREHTCSRVILA